MKNWLKENPFRYLFFIAIVAVIVIIFGLPAGKSNQLIAVYEREESPIPPLLPIEQAATCSFNSINSVSFEFREKESESGGRAPLLETEKAKIYFDSSKESQPNIISFSNLDTENPTMVANAGQSELVKIYESDEVLHMVEKTPLSFGSVVVYAIFKNQGIAIWTKQYSLLGIPVGYQAMGYCK